MRSTSFLVNVFVVNPLYHILKLLLFLFGSHHFITYTYEEKQISDDELLNKFREILKEELCGISVTASAPSPSSESFNMELTEDEKQNPFCCTVYFFNNSVKIRNINISKRYS